MEAKFEATTVTEDLRRRNIRHAEKRRVATCTFADRVAQVSIDTYHRVVSEKDRPPHTCLATIVAHDVNDGGNLMVVGLGVGTKFLEEKILQEESSSSTYGKRIRDCHAEILARRTFRRQISLEILADAKRNPASATDRPRANRILERTSGKEGGISYQLRNGVSLHFYSSSAPCGNATLKKFAKMSKEKFRGELGIDQWPEEPHNLIPDASIHLGQFSLLIKKSNDAALSKIEQNKPAGSENLLEHENSWPAKISDDWTPPGTTIVSMRHKGSIHSCSDKLARWNYLGLQGSLLVSCLTGPLYLSSISIGRKFTECICRRAVCCRLETTHRTKKRRASTRAFNNETHQEGHGNSSERATHIANKAYHYNHPAVMGNAVYMDETGVIATKRDVRGQDVRFHSSLVWCWWPSKEEDGNSNKAECINGATGYLWESDDQQDASGKISLVSTLRLAELFLDARKAVLNITSEVNGKEMALISYRSLEGLKTVKRELSPDHESIKDSFLSKHVVFRQWRRRS